jgi:hypothetical protein
MASELSARVEEKFISKKNEARKIHFQISSDFKLRSFLNRNLSKGCKDYAVYWIDSKKGFSLEAGLSCDSSFAYAALRYSSEDKGIEVISTIRDILFVQGYIPVVN